MGQPPWLRGFVRAYHPVDVGSNHKHTINAISINSHMLY